LRKRLWAACIQREGALATAKNGDTKRAQRVERVRWIIFVCYFAKSIAQRITRHVDIDTCLKGPLKTRHNASGSASKDAVRSPRDGVLFVNQQRDTQQTGYSTRRSCGVPTKTDYYAWAATE
jgi:hypothetical protein